MYANEATSESTGELHLSDDEAAAIRGYGKFGDAATGISDEEVANGMQAFIDEKFGTSVDKTAPQGIREQSRKKLTRSIEALRKSQPAPQRRKLPKIGAAAIREEARTLRAASADDKKDHKNKAASDDSSTVILAEQKSKTHVIPFAIPAIAEMDPRLDKLASEARTWMFSDEANHHKNREDTDLSTDDVMIAVSDEYSKLTRSERRKLYKTRLHALNRQRVLARKNREQAGKSGSSLFSEMGYRLAVLKARFSRG
jgi:hypothetical protein